MSTPRRRKGSGPAEAPKIQDRPAAPAQPKAATAPVLDPNNRDGEFLPNPTPSAREGRPQATTRQLRVVGPKPMGPDGVRAPGWLELDLTDDQLDALLAGGHVEDWTGVDGWGEDDTPEAETEASGVAVAGTAEGSGTAETGGAEKPDNPPADEPTTGTEKEGN